MPQKSQTKENGNSQGELNAFGSDAKLGSDFSLFVIMIALILFCISAYLGYGHLNKLLGTRQVTPSIPDSHVIYDK